MKLVFLDCDGVVNSMPFLMDRTRMREPMDWSTSAGKVAGFLQMVDPKNVAHLNDLLRRSGAFIVLSSSWRHALTLEEFRNVAVRVGIEGEVLGFIPTVLPMKLSRELPRGFGVDAWLADRLGPPAGPMSVVDSFVALDDDADLEPYKDRLVRTNPHVGLTPADVEAALTILDKPWKGKAGRKVRKLSDGSWEAYRGRRWQ